LVKGRFGKTTLEKDADRVRRIGARVIAIADGQPALPGMMRISRVYMSSLPAITA
jgi:hypothetical protein